MAPGACLRTFVSASWTMRYTARSTVAGSSRGRPSTCCSTRRPVAVKEVMSCGSRSSPGTGSGAVSASSWSGRTFGWRRRPTVVRSSSSADRPACRMWARAVRAWIGRGLQDVRRDSRLHVDQRDVVGQHVMQLPCDAQAFFHDAPGGLLLARVFGTVRAFLDRRDVGALAACGLAHRRRQAGLGDGADDHRAEPPAFAEHHTGHGQDGRRAARDRHGDPPGAPQRDRVDRHHGHQQQGAACAAEREVQGGPGRRERQHPVRPLAPEDERGGDQRADHGRPRVQRPGVVPVRHLRRHERQGVDRDGEEAVRDERVALGGPFHLGQPGHPTTVSSTGRCAVRRAEESAATAIAVAAPRLSSRAARC